MILVDAVHINMGGGLNLLKYLISNLISSQIPFELLKDSRCPKIEGEYDSYNLYVVEPKNRKTFYRQISKDYKMIFCFANIPVPVKMSCPCITYFHNINLLKIPKTFPIKRKLMNFLKATYINGLKDNSDLWIVQTTNTKQELIKRFKIDSTRILQLPFYSIEGDVDKNDNIRTDYILVGDYTGTRGHDELLEAWKLLHDKNLNATLHLTIDFNQPVIPKLKLLQEQGVNIINHGIIPFRALTSLYKRSKATIYPSINESLGLGIIEAIKYGCDVIAPDLPYVHAICNPSGLIQSITSQSIAEAVIKYEDSVKKESTLKINNCINELIELIAAYEISSK